MSLQDNPTFFLTDPCSAVTQADVANLALRVTEALQLPPESLEAVKEIRISLTRVDVTIVPNR